MTKSKENLEVKISPMLEENAKLSSKILELETKFDEMTEDDKKTMPIPEKLLKELETSQTRKLERLQQELKLLQYTNSRLECELASKDEWIQVLLDHLQMKNAELRRIKTQCVDLKVEFDQELEKIAERISKLTIAKGFLARPEPKEDFLSPLRNSLDKGLYDSPVLDVLRKSVLLGHSIECSKLRPGNLILAMAESKGDNFALGSQTGMLDNRDSSEFGANFRESIEFPLSKQPSLRQSVQRKNTITRVRGGNSIIRLQEGQSDERENQKEQEDINIVNVFDIS